MRRREEQEDRKESWGEERQRKKPLCLVNMMPPWRRGTSQSVETSRQVLGLLWNEWFEGGNWEFLRCVRWLVSWPYETKIRSLIDP